MKHIYTLPIIFSLWISGCQTTSERAVLSEIAPTHNKMSYQFNGFPIYGWKNIKNPSDPNIHVYIEGDGYAYISRSRPSSNPTPTRPIGHDLAMVDTISSNIIYLGRPCHYATAHDLKSGCDRKYWTTHRFASDVIRAYDDILDDISQQYPNMKYNLIGFSGGANIAGLLSAKRDDIASLRTVAGNVDNDFFTRHHKVSDMPYSLNMANYVENLSNIPQMHFTAQNDKFVPVNVYNNYQSRLPNTSCTQSETIKGTKHLDGWRERWNRLLRRTPFCK